MNQGPECNEHKFLVLLWTDMYRQISNIRRTLIENKIIDHWSIRCSWSIACRRCSNYIFIMYSTAGFNGLGKDNHKWETFQFWDLVRLILEVWRYIMYICLPDQIMPHNTGYWVNLGNSASFCVIIMIILISPNYRSLYFGWRLNNCLFIIVDLVAIILGMLHQSWKFRMSLLMHICVTRPQWVKVIHKENSRF